LRTVSFWLLQRFKDLKVDSEDITALRVALMKFLGSLEV
jgi:hypothetical protein